MALSPLAGKPAPQQMLVDPSRLAHDYLERRPDPDDPAQQVSFGTSGHRGSSLRDSFNEAHILAITQAICEYRHARAVTGPLYMGKDTHALSGPACRRGVKAPLRLRLVPFPLGRSQCDRPNSVCCEPSARQFSRVQPSGSVLRHRAGICLPDLRRVLGDRRSLENLPEPATLRIALRAHSSRSP